MPFSYSQARQRGREVAEDARRQRREVVVLKAPVFALRGVQWLSHKAGEWKGQA